MIMGVLRLRSESRLSTAVSFGFFSLLPLLLLSICFFLKKKKNVRIFNIHILYIFIKSHFWWEGMTAGCVEWLLVDLFTFFRGGFGRFFSHLVTSVWCRSLLLPRFRCVTATRDSHRLLTPPNCGKRSDSRNSIRSLLSRLNWPALIDNPLCVGLSVCVCGVTHAVTTYRSCLTSIRFQVDETRLLREPVSGGRGGFEFSVFSVYVRTPEFCYLDDGGKGLRRARIRLLRSSTN